MSIFASASDLRLRFAWRWNLFVSWHVCLLYALRFLALTRFTFVFAGHAKMQFSYVQWSTPQHNSPLPRL